jgi:hypothetical protein
MLKVVLDIPVVRRIGSVKAQKPIDCPGKESMITKQEMAKTMQFSTFSFTAIDIVASIKDLTCFSTFLVDRIFGICEMST